MSIATQRTRTMSSRIPFHMGHEMYVAPGGSESYATDYGMYAGYGSVQTMTDTVGASPKWEKGFEGYSYNPMTSHKDIISGSPCSYRLKLLSNGAMWYSAGNPLPGLLPVLQLPTGDTVPMLHSQDTLDALQSAAATACWAERGKGPTNSMENVLQLHKAIDEIRHPFRNFTLWSDRWVSTRIARARKVRGSQKTQVAVGKEVHVDSIASAWLQYRYGLRLLIKDVTEIISRYNNAVAQRPSVITARGKKSSSISDRHETTLFAGPGQWSSSYTIDETITTRATSHDYYVMDMLEQIGFSGKAILSVGWELIPYSFVVDWFANVSDFLNASIPNPNMRHIGECLSTKRITTLQCQARPIGAQSGWQLTGSQGTHNITTVVYSRGLTLGTPTLQIQPDFRFDTFTRTADAVALAFGALTRAFGGKGRISISTGYLA